MNNKFFYKRVIFLALSLVLAIPSTLAIHFWSQDGFSVSRVGLETFDTLTNFSKQGNGCSIIDGHLNCPLDSGVTYNPLPNPDGNTLPNLSTNTNNFTIEWDMQILSTCQDGWYPVLWTNTNASQVTVPISINNENGAAHLWKEGGNQLIENVLPDNTWHHWKATFYANSSSIYTLSIAINGTDKNNILIPSPPVSMSFQFVDDHCSINADNLTMYNGTVFPFEVFPQNASLTILKLLYNNDTGTKSIGDFTLKVNDTAVTSGIPISLESGVYQVSELEDIGYNSSISGDCDSNGFITVSPGENKICIITNDDVPTIENSTLTIIKIVVNNDTCAPTSSNFTLLVNGSAVYNGIPTSLQPGFYNVNEVQNLNYVKSFYGDCDSSGNVILGLEQSKTCIILNDDIIPAINNSVNNTFSDNFNRPNSTVLGNGWKEISGDFQILNMQLRNNGTGTHKAVVDAFSGFNLSSAANFTSVNNNAAPTFGIILRYQDQNNFYLFYRRVGGSSFVRISKFVNGVESILASAAISNPITNVPFRLEGKAIGNNLSIIVDGSLKSKINDSTFLSGKTGIFVKTQSNFNFIADNFFATNKP